MASNMEDIRRLATSMVKADDHLTITIWGKLAFAFLSDTSLTLSYIELADTLNIQEEFVADWSRRMYGDSLVIAQPAGKSSTTEQSVPIPSTSSFPNQFAMTSTIPFDRFDSAALIEDNFMF